MSPRLKAKLIHPNKTGNIADIVWSPDGTRIIAVDYLGGTVQVWEVATGKQLIKIDTKVKGFRTNIEKLNITSDWKTLFTTFDKRRTERFERDGKAYQRVNVDGGVRIWDLSSGKALTTLRYSPPCAVVHAKVSPDGRYLVAHETPAGEFENNFPQSASLWDLKTQERRDFLKGMIGFGAFDSKGERFAAGAASGINTSEIKVVSIPTLRELCSIPITTPHTRAHVHSFSPDGSMMIGFQQTFPEKNKFDTWDYDLKFWDAANGKELASIPAPEKGTFFLEPVFSPNGRQLATSTIRGQTNPVCLIDAQTRKVTRTISLGDGAVYCSPSFSPDGQWIAVASRVIPKELERSRDEDPDMFPQARIHLVDTKTGAVRETMIAPPAFVNKVVFSPDGKTLASDGHGKVLLWDVADITASRGK